MRTVITTSYTGRQWIDYLIQEALWKILQEDWYWILLERSIYNIYSTRDVVATNYS